MCYADEVGLDHGVAAVKKFESRPGPKYRVVSPLLEDLLSRNGAVKDFSVN